jgi:hypothetical protein
MALLVSQNAMALKVYQWKDEEGVVHYSDAPPQDNASPDINEIEMANFDENNADSDKYSIVNQLEQMTAWRRQAEEDQRAWKQLQLEEERLAQEQQSSQPAADTSTDTYYPNTYYPLVYSYPYPVNFPRYTKRHGHRFPDNHFGIGIKGPHGKFTAGFNKYSNQYRGSLVSQEIGSQGQGWQ